MSADAALLERAEVLIRAYAAAGKRIATAESCTGGLVAGLLTAVPGSSSVVERGFVTYSNEAKSEMLGVLPELIAEHGAVSEAVARAMARGARQHARADVAVAVTGVAGPGGGSAAKPVGLVHFGLAWNGGEDGATRHRERRYGPLDRRDIRERAVADALHLLHEALAGLLA